MAYMWISTDQFGILEIQVVYRNDEIYMNISAGEDISISRALTVWMEHASPI